jgi:hypothetical protein
LPAGRPGYELARLEEFLALLYTDEAALAAFLLAPDETARAAGLDAADVSAMVAADHRGLVMAADSYRAKRARRISRRPFLQRLRG